MLVNEYDVLVAKQRRKDLRREAEQVRLAQASRLSRSDRSSKRQIASLLARIWLLF